MPRSSYLHRRSRDRRPGRHRHARHRAAGEPADPRPLADRRAVRVAPPNREGRIGRRSGLRGADPCRGLPGSASCPTSSTTSTRCAPPTSFGSIGSSSRHTSSSTSPPRKWRTRACRSPSGAACTRDRHLPRGVGSRRDRWPDRHPRASLLAWRRRREEAHLLARAADAARASYANAAAVDYLTRLVPLFSGGDRIEALLKLGKAREFTGDWPTAEATALEARDLAAELGDDASRGWAEVALAESTRKQGRYDEAAEHLSAARRHFDTAGLDDGVGQVLHLAGTVAAQRGESPKPVSATRRASRSASGSATRPRSAGSTRTWRSSPSTRATWRLRGRTSSAHWLSGGGRRPMGDRRQREQPRDDRPSRWRVRRRPGPLRDLDAPQSRDRRCVDGRHRPQQPRQRDARPR